MTPDSAPNLHLAQHFLIAMPDMQDDAFAQSVVYVCEHGERGALGLCINKLSHMALPELFVQLGLPLGRADLRGATAGWGGPVQPERGFVLHLQEAASYTSSLIMPDGLQMTTSRDILEALSQNRGPQKLLVALGYAAWEPGQLEAEVRNNSWLTVPAEPGIIFDIPREDRYDCAMSLLGVQPWALSSGFGSA